MNEAATVESNVRVQPRVIHRLGDIFLMTFFLGLSVAFGGAVYSSRVVEDLWSSSPPASLRQWAPAMNAAGANFWSKITPLTGLLAILTLWTAFSATTPGRKWRIAGSLLFVVVAISSVAYFAPTIGRLSPPAVDELSSADASAMVRRWTALDSARMLGVAGAWACTLRAITLR